MNEKPVKEQKDNVDRIFAREEKDDRDICKKDNDLAFLVL